ncbi:MAG: molybdopterin cofactor-binding domain-containing protein [Candidatus Binataceae bacterium]
MNAIENVSRRGFLKGMLSTGALILSVHFLPTRAGAAAMSIGSTRADRAALHPSAFVGVDSDGTVYIVAHRSEMGTGIRTSLPLVVADELDADWKLVKVEQAIGDWRYGAQDTDGSHSIREFFDVMRKAGATARLMLIEAAAAQWKIAPGECETGLHEVMHRRTGRKMGYGALAAAASKLPVPRKEAVLLKNKSQWRYIGKGHSSYDLAALCMGKAVYGMDARVDGMVYAAVAHPPVLGGRVKSYDDKEALKVKGVRQVVAIEPFKPPAAFQPLGGLAVIADNTWAAFQGRKKLALVWDNDPDAAYNSAQYKKELFETVRAPGRIARNAGDVDAEFKTNGRVIEAEYYIPHLAHAPMEPPVAVAEYRDGKVTAWTCTQNPQAVQDIVAEQLKIPRDNVICHVTLLGGGFGRKSKPDYVAEAAVLSKKVGRPVKVVWSREDDIKFGYYHTVSAIYMKAALDAKGKPIAWLQRSVFPPIASTFKVGARYGSAGDLGLGWTDIPYDIPNLRIENGPAKAYVRIGWLRSVGNIYHAFAIQSFSDELAHAAGRDPVDYLLELIGSPRIVDLKGTDYPNYSASYTAYPIDTGRLRRVVLMAAEKAGWGKRKTGNGAGMGIAVHRSFLTYVATVVEVEIDSRGKLKIPRVHYAVDAGLITNPEFARAQFEGSAVFGASLARSGEITATNGAIDQSNFHDYPVARMPEAPQRTDVYLVDSDAPPAGIGEPGVPPFAPALCNAIFAATGKRVRELPLSKHQIT